MPVRYRFPTRTVRRPLRRRRRSDSELDLSLPNLVPHLDRIRSGSGNGSARNLDANVLLQAQKTLGNQAVMRVLEERRDAPRNGERAALGRDLGDSIQRDVVSDIWEGMSSAVETAVEWLGEALEGAGGGKGNSGKGTESKSGGKGSGSKPKGEDPKTEPEKKKKKKKATSAIKQATLTKTELDELNKKGKSILGKEWAELAAEKSTLNAEKKPLWKRRKSKKDPLSETEQKRLDELVVLIKKKTKRINAIKLILAKSDIERELDAAKSSVDKWFGDIDTSATFLGVRIRPSKGSVAGGVHKEMVDQLKKAEVFLMQPAMQKKHGYKNEKEAAKTFGISSIGGLRPPQAATGGSRVSMHCYGLAIDINASTNPFVGRSTTAIEVIKRATELVDGTPFNIGKRPKDITVMEMYDLLDKANKALQVYFTLASDDEKLTTKVEALNKKSEAGEEGDDKKKKNSKSVDQWKKQIVKDLKSLKGTDDFKPRDPSKGFMDLKRDLVDALVNAGGLTWGGFYKTGKDIMHFDYRKSGTIKR